MIQLIFHHKLQKHHTMSRVWEWMESAESLFLFSTMTSEHSHFVPSSIVVETIGEKSDVVRHLIESRAKTSAFQMLPQLIEVCFQQILPC